MEAGNAGFRLVSTDPAGGDRRVIVGGKLSSRFLPFPFSSPSWSGDGTRVAFTGFEQAGRKARLDIYTAAADGSGVTRLPGTRDIVGAVFSPDGRLLAFAREREREARRPRRGEATVYHSTSIWLLDTGHGVVRQLTPWGNKLFAVPSSFSPDGSTLAISRKSRGRRSAVAIRIDGSEETVLAGNAAEPVYSPDGTRLALITLGKERSIERGGEWLTFSPSELAVAAADGSGLTKLTRTRNLELTPSWDPSGQRIAYTLITAALGEDALLGTGDSIMEINAEGSCKTIVLSVPKVSLFGATWQPGPGREAGPISC
jgi:Tol biopolymer transport system component